MKYLLTLLLLFTACTIQVHVPENKIILHDTLWFPVEIHDTAWIPVDTIIKWEPFLELNNAYYGDTVHRIWMQWQEGGEWHQYLLKHE